MSKNIIQNIVIILGILIIISFSALLYGIYGKISISGKDFENLSENFSVDLKDYEKIINIEVINNNKLLILIESDGNIKGGIYDIKNNRIINFIER